MLRVGFIGCGRHATKCIFPSLHYAPVELVAVCDLDESRARRNARWFGARHYYTDFRLMCEHEKMDAVFLVGSVNMHQNLAVQLLEEGYHVFVEKPPAKNLAELEEIIKTAKKTKKSIMVGMMKRHAPVYRRMKEIISSSEFGRVNLVEAKLCGGTSNRTGYSLLVNAGIHLIDLIIFLMGDYQTVSARVCSLHRFSHSYVITMQFLSEAVGSLVVSNQQSWMRANERVEITGEENWVLADNLIRFFHCQKNNKVDFWEPGFSIPNDENLSFILGGYVPEIQHFAETILAGGVPRPGVEELIPSYRLIKKIEPNEDYYNEPVEHQHWKSENAWLNRHVE